VLANAFNYLFPMSSSLLASGEKERFRRIFLRSSSVYALLSGIALGALFLFGTAFLRLWVGAAVADHAAGVFRLLVIAALPAQLAGSFLNGIVLGTGHLRLYISYTVAKTALLTTGLLVGIRYWSLAGTGIAYLLASIAEIAYLVVVVRTVLEFPFLHFLRVAYARPLIVTIILTVAFWPLQAYASSWLRVSVSCALYIAAGACGATVTGILSRADLAQIRLFVRTSWSRVVASVAAIGRP
jgi:O-antigen/teichoic acid export membrane protein